MPHNWWGKDTVCVGVCSHVSVCWSLCQYTYCTENTCNRDEDPNVDMVHMMHMVQWGEFSTISDELTGKKTKMVCKQKERESSSPPQKRQTLKRFGKELVALKGINNVSTVKGTGTVVWVGAEDQVTGNGEKVREHLLAGWRMAGNRQNGQT